MKISTMTLVLAMAIGSITAFAETAKQAPAADLSKENRVKMAEHMEKMSACLKSDKNMDDCRKEAMENCPVQEKGTCMSMGPGMMGPGMRMGKGGMMGKGMGPGMMHTNQTANTTDKAPAKTEEKK